LAYWRHQKWAKVVAFTAATQIPGISDRLFPGEIAGGAYKEGIKIYPELQLPQLIKEHGVSLCDLAYSDLPYNTVGHLLSAINAAGSSFVTLAPEQTWLQSTKPVISICAVRTGSGKSQTTRFVCAILKKLGKKVVVVRHPMPYGDLIKERVERYERPEDLVKYQCTIEEREEYEAHIEAGNLLYAGVDYEAILREAEQEADVIVWDGGNNDAPFFKPDLHIVVADALRPGHERLYFPGETNARIADLLLINKVNAATEDAIKAVEGNLRTVNPKAPILRCKSTLTAKMPDLSHEEARGFIQGKRVLVVEDGPTMTHGGMSFGAAFQLARQEKAADIISPASFAKGSIKDMYSTYPHLKNVLPAMGYSSKQVGELHETIREACKHVDTVVIGTPIDITKLFPIPKPVVRVRYELEPCDAKPLEDAIKKVFGSRPPGMV